MTVGPSRERARPQDDAAPRDRDTAPLEGTAAPKAVLVRNGARRAAR